jgi:hypothetical protein
MDRLRRGYRLYLRVMLGLMGESPCSPICLCSGRLLRLRFKGWNGAQDGLAQALGYTLMIVWTLGQLYV